MQDISDEQLRASLAEFMKDVPPVTDSTRHVLMSKLKKYMDENTRTDLPLENLGSKIMNNLPEKHVREPSPVNAENLFLSPKKQAENEVMNSPPQTRSPIKPILTKSSLPSNPKSSPVLEYVQRLPSYRRRSIHPNRPLLEDPYSDLDFSITSNASPKVRMASVKRWSDKSNKHISFLMHYTSLAVNYVRDTIYNLAVGKRYLKCCATHLLHSIPQSVPLLTDSPILPEPLSWLRILTNRVPKTAVSVSIIQCKLISRQTHSVDPFKTAFYFVSPKGRIGAQRISIRQYLYFAFLLTFLVIMACFLIGDPFYHNPVKDLRSFIKLPNF